jgi:putative ABC transport system permease protein
VKLRRFSGLSFRNLRARVQRTLLTAVGIVLGVGIVFGVLTLSHTMSATFKDLFTRAYGSSDLTITAAGGSGGFDQKVVQKVRGYEGVGSAAPSSSKKRTVCPRSGACASSASSRGRPAWRRASS